MQRYLSNFRPASTNPTFSASADSTTAQVYALESSATGRVWAGPSGRSVRFSVLAAQDYYVRFGSSTAVAIASSGAMAMLGGAVETVTPTRPQDSYISLLGATTDVTVNVTIGYGS